MTATSTTYDALPVASQTSAAALFCDQPDQHITHLFQDEATQITLPAQPLLHEQVLSYLLEQLTEPIDLHRLAGLHDGRDKLTTMHYTVVTIREVLALAARHAYRLCYRQGFPYLHNGSYWKQLDEATLRYFLREAAARMGVPDIKANYHGFVDQLYNQFRETASLPASPPSTRESVSINLQNGTYDISLDWHGLRHPNPADFLTHELPFAFNPEATAPRWQSFLNRVLPDEASQHVLAEFFGYVFIPPGKLKLEKVLLLHGTGANGKSVVFEVMTALLGPENVSNYSLGSLTSEQAYSRANLGGKLVNYASELGSGKLEADTFKRLASGEPIEARLPYGQPFIMTDYAKLIFNTNELPMEVEHTHAYFRRFLIIPFTKTIPEAEQDKTLAAKIIGDELPGVFNWVLAGLQRLLVQQGFTDSPAIRAQLDAYKKKSDSVRLFLEEHSYVPDDDCWVKGQDVYQQYKFFCQEDGYRPLGRQKFTERLEKADIPVKRNSQGQLLGLRRQAIL